MHKQQVWYCIKVPNGQEFTRLCRMKFLEKFRELRAVLGPKAILKVRSEAMSEDGHELPLRTLG